MWIYVVACVVVPAVWGVAVHAAFEALARRRRRSRTPPADYVI